MSRRFSFIRKLLGNELTVVGTSSHTDIPSHDVTVVILHRNLFDCDALECLVSCRGGYRVVGTATSMHSYLKLCEHAAAGIAILDASFPPAAGDVFFQAQILKCRSKVRELLFLDDFPNLMRARSAVAIDGAGYVTKQRTWDQFLSALGELVEGRPPLDGFLVDWLHTEHGMEQRLQSASPQLTQLTPREREVFQLLAQGQSVASCANILQLATHTIENHKKRLMKKLGVKKAAQLIHVAIREGVVAP